MKIKKTQFKTVQNYFKPNYKIKNKETGFFVIIIKLQRKSKNDPIDSKCYR